MKKIVKKNQKIFFLIALFLICIVGFMCVFGNVTPAYSADASEITPSKQSVNEEASNEKIYCDATLEDNFADDTVLVVMADDVETTSEQSLNTIPQAIESKTVNTFSEIDCSSVEILTECSSETIKQQTSKISQISISACSDEDNSVINALPENQINVGEFREIISLELKTPGKNNVLEAIDQLERRDDVIYAGPDYIYTLESTSIAETSDDPKVGEQWAIEKIDLPEAWEKFTKNTRVTVGVIDTGIDASHPDLTDNIDRSLSRDFSQGKTEVDSSPTDPNGHGTHVAGIIGADGDNGIGIAGVYWNTNLVSLKAFDSNNNYLTSNIIRAVDFAASVNIPILNFSGGQNGNDIALKQSIDNYRGLFVCSAGNDNLNTDVTLHYPSNYNNMNNVISVGASNQNDLRPTNWIDKNGNRHGSNYGAESVDIFAPGDHIYSTIPGGGYGYKYGTSMATPYVTGVAALILSQYPDMNAGTLKANILESADKVQAFSGLCKTGGRLNAANELTVLNTSVTEKTGTSWRIKVTNPSDSTVEAVYNAKMCFEGDATAWNSLTDIRYMNLSPGMSTTVTVSENAFATHIAFSYINGDKRYITYSDKLNTDGTLDSSFQKIDAHLYDCISLVGKRGGYWIVKVTNNFSDRRKVEYNTQMCNSGDAASWSGGLKNIESAGYLDSGESVNFEITVFSFASYIAVSLSNNSSRSIRYAKDLNDNTTMTVYTSSAKMHLYLQNEGKSGSNWQIKITNPLNRGVTAYYNTKMCNSGDAKNWTGLVHTTSIYIAADSSATVSISTYWFATSVAISYFNNGERLISYADGLNDLGGINVKYNCI